MLGKTLDSLRSDMVAAYLERLPQLDLTEGTPERDLFIEAPIAGSLYYLHQSLDYLYKLHAPFIYYDELSDADIDEFCRNFGVEPLGPTKSTGIVTFYTYTEPTDDIVIPKGTIVTTSGDQPIEFQTVSTVTLYNATKSAFFNTQLNRWEVNASVESISAGTDYRAGSNTVKVISSSITGIDGCTNANPISGGTDGEDNLSKLQKVLDKFQGRNLGTLSGLRAFVKQFTPSCIIVPSGDPLMLRDGGFGGCVDIYVVGEQLATYTESVEITSLGLLDPANTKYSTTSIRFEKQPTLTIVSCLVNDTPLPPSYFQLVKDDNIISRNSTASFDKLELTTEGINNFGYFQSGQVVTVVYIYNALLHTITDALTSDAYYYLNRDYLVRGFTKVTIDVQISVAFKKGYSFETYMPLAQLVIADAIDRNALSGSIEKSDIVTSLGKESYVDNINLASCVLTPSGGGTLTTYGDVLLSKNEYAVSGVISITEWV